MTINLSKAELQHIRKIIGGLNHTETTKIFNQIFTKSGYEGIVGFVNPVTEKIELNIPEKSVNIVGEVFEKYAPVFGRSIKKGIGLSTATGLVDTVKCIGKELQLKFKVKR